MKLAIKKTDHFQAPLISADFKDVSQQQAIIGMDILSLRQPLCVWLKSVECSVVQRSLSLLSLWGTEAAILALALCGVSIYDCNCASMSQSRFFELLSS